MTTWYKLLHGDALSVLRGMESGSINCCVTSPPYYGLRDYGVSGQIGLEKTPEEYISSLVEIFREVKRVLRDDGVLWVNIGDSYAGSGKGRCADGIARLNSPKQLTNAGSVGGKVHKAQIAECKPKDMIGIPWMLAFALRNDGWYLRQDVIWAKRNPMPESVTDRCTKSHEYIFMLTKNRKYAFDHTAIQEDADEKYVNRYKYRFNDGKAQNTPRPRRGQNTAGIKQYTGKRNKRDVWWLPASDSCREAHFATFPKKLVEPCILSTCCEGGGGSRPVQRKRNNGDRRLIPRQELYRDRIKSRIQRDRRKADKGRNGRGLST